MQIQCENSIFFSLKLDVSKNPNFLKLTQDLAISGNLNTLK